MTVSIINDFASLGAALKQREQAKQPAKVADVPTAPVNNYPAPNWADIYTNAPAVDYTGFVSSIDRLDVATSELNEANATLNVLIPGITMTRAEFDAKYGPGSRCPPMVTTKLVLPAR